MKTLTRTCVICEAHFHPPRSNRAANFCSHACLMESRRRANERICPRCGQGFQPEFRNAKKRYCSVACANRTVIGGIGPRVGRGKVGRTTVPLVDLSCQRCGMGFQAEGHRRRRFCSQACARSAQSTRVSFVCGECGKEFEEKRCLVGRRQYCSRKCKDIGHLRKLRALKPTKIEREVWQALEALGIRFERERKVGTYLVDAWLPTLNAVIEVQGDFWHCNPAVYPDGPICAIQRNTTARDQKRLATLTGQGFRVIELWERDINACGALALTKEAIGRLE